MGTKSKITKHVEEDGLDDLCRFNVWTAILPTLVDPGSHLKT